MSAEGRYSIWTLEGVVVVTFRATSKNPFEKTDMERFKEEEELFSENLKGVRVIVDLSMPKLCLFDSAKYGLSMLLMVYKAYQRACPDGKIILVTGPNHRVVEKLFTTHLDMAFEVEEEKSTENVLASIT